MLFRAAGVLISLSFVASSMSLFAADKLAVYEMGARRELFVDDFLIEKLVGARLRLHRPTPRGAAMDMNKPWEGNESIYVTVFQDSNRYRMYYRGRNVKYDLKGLHIAHPEVVCYAESKDGIHWVRPKLRLFAFNGSKENNILWKGVGVHNFSPFKDTNPDCKPSERYKAVGHGKGGLHAFKSSDGLHWKKMSSKPVITNGAFDSHNVVFWDRNLKAYREFHRDFRTGRDIRTSVSNNFLKWGNSRFLGYSSPQRDRPSPRDSTKSHPKGRVSQLYTNNIVAYDRAPHILLGFPTRYIDRGWNETTKTLPNYEYRKLRGAVSKREGSAMTDGMFMSSRDGQQFKVWPESFIRPGLRKRDNWFYGDNYQNWGLVQTKSAFSDGPQELSLYVSEGALQGNSLVLRRFTMRIDGFVSVEAPLSGGRLLTRPLRFQGGRLSINFSTSAVGTLRAELQTVEGKPVEGFAMQDCLPLYGDSLQGIIRWKGGTDVSKLAGRPLRILFQLKDADLYSIKFVK